MITVRTKHRRHSDDTLRAWLCWFEPRCCNDCELKKPVREFHVHTRYECGLARIWQSYCKECQRERTRFHARERRRRLGIPERNGKPYKIRTGHHESGYKDLVPVGPFQQWLVAKITEIDARTAYFDEINHPNERFTYTHKVSGIVEIARKSLVDPELIRRFSKMDPHGPGKVTLGFVDRVLVHTESSTQLWELYPDE